MRKIHALALAVSAAASLAGAAPDAVLQPVVTGLSSPLEVSHAGDGSQRLFVVEQGGRIRVVRDGRLLATPFLDLAGQVKAGGEEGLLGLAFHPAYAANGRFFVFYNRALAPAAPGSEIVVARYRRSAANADVADASSGEIVITIAHPGATNHNGGKIAFGRDGLLYIAVGDGGGGGDPFGAAANLADLRGKILRIDVDSGSPYQVPASNPHAGQPGRRGEILMHGLRNPWRFGFDRATGDLFVADVGEGAWEEVNHVPAAQVAAGGHDFGWSRWEGRHCYPPGSACVDPGGLTFPVIEYGRDQGGSVTGGYRYRGRAFPELDGYYVYGDFVSGRIWAAAPAADGTWAAVQVARAGNVSTFGEDEAGEIHLADFATGTVSRLAPRDSDGDGMSDAFETAHFGHPTAGDAAADGDGDGMPNGLEYRERRDPAIRDHDVFADARLFAMQQYRDFLAREGEPGGIEFWAGRIAQGLPRASVAAFFLSSPEFQQHIAPVARLYFAYFQRIPDIGGLTFWVDYLDAGNTLAAVSGFFAASPEFRATYGDLGHGAFVDLVYRLVLQRAPTASERASWERRLAVGTSTRGQMMLAFSEGAEFRAVSGNEVLVSMAYAGMLRRAPDAGGFAFWVRELDRGATLEGFLGGFITSAEYRSRFLAS